MQNNIFNLEGKVAIVTGGYGHLGRAMVEGLRDFGAKVIVAGRSFEKFKETFSSDEDIYFKEVDILSTEKVRDVFLSVYKDFGRIDVVVNNAHTIKGFSQENLFDEEWIYSVEGVLGTVHRSIRQIIPIYKEQGFGKIINISSMYGVVSPDFNLYKGDNCEPFTNPPHYGAAKAGVIQITKYYAAYLGKDNIQVNAVVPGPFPKKQIQESNPIFIERLKNRNPLKKIGKPEDLIGVIILLSTDASNFITGQAINVDGGWTIW